MEFQRRGFNFGSLMADRLIPAQIRGARGVLDWSIVQLADAADLSVSTIKRMELSGQQPISKSAYATVQAAFESAGVHFLYDEGGGWAVQVRPR